MRFQRRFSLLVLALAWGLSACSGVPQAPYKPPVAVHLKRTPLEELPKAVSVLDSPPVRVLLRKGAQGLKTSAPSGLRLLNAAGRELARVPASGKARLNAKHGALYYNGLSLGTAEAILTTVAAGESVKVAGRRYAGRLVVKVLEGQLALLNVVGLEDYVRGVLPGEVPADWPKAALQAQAVAARTFAASRMVKGEAAPFDVDDSTTSQVYKGMDSQKPGPDEAVRSTRNQVLTYGGHLAETFFHSNSGGCTADAADVWGGAPIAYLPSVQDPYSEDQQHYAWSAKIGLEQAERRLVKAGVWKGLLTSVQGGDRGDCGRWKNLELLGPGIKKVIKAQAFRQALGGDLLRSTRFRVQTEGDNLVFDGLGWGHGVGLSQEGALAQAKEGHSYTYILSFYYPGTRLAALR